MADLPLAFWNTTAPSAPPRVYWTADSNLSYIPPILLGSNERIAIRRRPQWYRLRPPMYIRKPLERSAGPALAPSSLCTKQQKGTATGLIWSTVSSSSYRTAIYQATQEAHLFNASTMLLSSAHSHSASSSARSRLLGRAVRFEVHSWLLQ